MATRKSTTTTTPATLTDWTTRLTELRKAADETGDRAEFRKVLDEASNLANQHLAALTPDKVREASNEESAENALALAISYAAADELRKAADSRDGSIMAAAAYTTFDALTNRGVGRNVYAAQIGKSTGYITMLRRLGRVAFDLNITPDTEPEVWNLLANKGGANVSVVGKSIDPDPVTDPADPNKTVPVEPTREGLDAALAVAFDENGKKRSESQIKAVLNPPTPDEGEGRDEDAGTEPVPPTRSIEAQVRDALDLLRRLVPNMTDEGVMSVEDAWNQTETVVRTRFAAALDAASA